MASFNKKSKTKHKAPWQKEPRGYNDFKNEYFIPSYDQYDFCVKYVDRFLNTKELKKTANKIIEAFIQKIPIKHKLIHTINMIRRKHSKKIDKGCIECQYFYEFYSEKKRICLCPGECIEHDQFVQKKLE